MLNNRMLIPALIIPLVVALIVGLFFVFRSDEPKDPVQTDPIDTTVPDTDIIEIDPDYRFDHTIGDPVIEFDEGNEVFLDMSLVPYLERMEFGTPAVDEDGNYYFDADGDIEYNADEEKHIEGVLDNLITLINHFAKEEYSMEASHQIQRFYVTYYDRFLETEYQPGGNYTANSSRTLYAIWESNAPKTYTVSYNANGGTGAPASQTKTHNVTLTLRTTTPTRSGYTFKGWSTSSTATTASYSAGGSYTTNASATMYAVWQKNPAATYTVSYNANGGSGAPASQTKTHNVTLTLRTTVPTRSGYTFKGWSTSSTATTATYHRPCDQD